MPSTIDVLRTLSWLERAACRAADTEIFFSPAADDVRRAIAICDRCAVVRACCEHALGRPELHGVWGATTEVERIVLRRAVPA